MSPRPTRRRAALTAAALVVAVVGVAATPYASSLQLARAQTLPADGALDPVARAAAEFAPSRSGERHEVESLAAQRRTELQMGAQTAPTELASARAANLGALRAAVVTAAQAAELKRLLDTRLEQDRLRTTRPAALKGITTPGAAAVLAYDPAATGRTVSPVAVGSFTLTAVFGQTGLWSPYHTGQDFAAPTGTPVVAVTDGVVSTSIGDDWAGNNVVVVHADGTASLYAHLDDVTVAPGTIVHAGDLVGHVGNTGRSFGAHLHFEIYPAGGVPGDNITCVDPMAWLRARGVAF